MDRLGTARAAIRGDRRGVGDRGLPVELDLRDHVHVLRHHLREERQERADRRVRARVGDRAHAHPRDRAVALEPHLDVVDVAAAVPHRDHVLGAGLGPLHRPAEQERGLATMRYSTVTPALAPKPPPTAAFAPRTTLGIEPELGRELVTHTVRTLRRGPERQPAVGLARHRDDPAGSIGTGATRWFTIARRDHHVGVVEHALDRAGTHRVGDVRSLRLEHHRRAGRDRGFHVDDDRERVVVDDHGFRRVDRLRPWSRRRPPRRCRRRTARFSRRAAGDSSWAATS